MLVLSRKNRESVVIGGTDGFHRLFKVTVLDIRRHARETGLRGRCRCPCPPFGGVGPNPRRGRSGRLTICRPSAVRRGDKMSTAISVVYYVIIELPGKACRMMLNFLREWWYSHYH